MGRSSPPCDWQQDPEDPQEQGPCPSVSTWRGTARTRIQNSVLFWWRAVSDVWLVTSRSREYLPPSGDTIPTLLLHLSHKMSTWNENKQVLTKKKKKKKKIFQKKKKKKKKKK